MTNFNPRSSSNCRTKPELYLSSNLKIFVSIFNQSEAISVPI